MLIKNIVFVIASTVILFNLQACERLFVDVAHVSVAERIMQKDGWNLAKLDTARSVSYLNEIEKDVVLVHNAVRSNPEKFAEIYVKEIRGYYGSNNILQYPGGGRYITQEGVSAVDELYRELKNQSAVPLLKPSKGMSQGSADHAKDQSGTGKLGHTGSDGSRPTDRVSRYGKGSAGENIMYGGDKTGLGIVLSLMIDDGVASRGHRKNILIKGYQFIGVGIDSHPTYGYSCTINYARDYQEK